MSNGRAAKYPERDPVKNIDAIKSIENITDFSKKRNKDSNKTKMYAAKFGFAKGIPIRI